MREILCPSKLLTSPILVKAPNRVFVYMSGFILFKLLIILVNMVVIVCGASVAEW